jgi:hypothetical protein
MKTHIVIGRCVALALLLGAATAAHAQLVISNDPTSNMSCNDNECSATAPQAVLNVQDLENGLTLGNFTVTGGGASEIEVEVPVAWSQESTLTMQASFIAIASTVQASGEGSLALDTSTSTLGPALSFPDSGNVTFLSTASNLTINGMSFKLENSVASLAADVSGDFTGNYALANDYDAGPDGTYKHPPMPRAYEGTFEGLGHTIANLKINANQRDGFVGLFSQTYASGTLRNIRLSKVKIAGGSGSETGGLVGDSQGLVVNAYVSGHVGSGKEFITGGVIGVAVGTVSQSQSAARVKGNEAGGLVGEIDGGIVEDSLATGQVEATAGFNEPVAGGLVGATSPGTIQTSYSTGVASGSIFGGSVGMCFQTTATNVYWDTMTSGDTLGCGEGSAGVTGLTTSQLKSGLPTGFSAAIWAEQRHVSRGMPYLLSLGPN